MNQQGGDQGCERQLQESTQKNPPPDFEQVVERKFHPDHEKQQDDPNFGHQFNLQRSLDDPHQFRSNQNTCQHIANDGWDFYPGKQIVDKG